MDCRQNFSRRKNNARFNSVVTSVDSNLGLLFKIQRYFANPRELQKPDTFAVLLLVYG